MRPAARLSRIGRAALPFTLLLCLSGCGSSATSVTSPSTIVRCSLQVQGVEGQIPAQGGSGAINVIAARDCTWSAISEGAWLSIKAGSSGQGDGTVEFTAAQNPDPAMRRGAILANGQRAEIMQAAADCVVTLSQSSASFGAAGGNGQIQVQASSGMCSWSASVDADWVTLRNTTGQGSGVVTFEVPPTTAPPRNGTVTIAGQKFSITQAEGCAYAIAPASHNIGAGGGSGAITVTTTPACPWTAASNVDWLKLTQPAGTGPASVGFSVAATSGPARKGTAVVAGHPFTVLQAQGCAYTVEPSSHTVDAAGGTVTVSVGGDPACTWTASVDAPWITIQGPTSSSGSRSLSLVVAPTTGPARTGTATIAGQRVTISQAQGCSFAISPENATVGAAGGSGKVTVTAGAGCSWTASSGAAWISVASGATGSGNGEVQYSVAATTGPGRAGTLTIAGRTFTINQGVGCTYTLSSGSANVANSGGDGSFTVQTAAGCAWSAASSAPWITLKSAANATGEGAVRFTVAANSGPPRTGTITAAGQTFTVSQGQGCTYALSSTSASIADAGGQGTFTVQTAAGCAWTTASAVSWITIASAANATGEGTVSFSVAANSGPSRSGAITAAGQTFTVTQGNGCTFAIAPASQNVPAAGGSGTVNVTAGSACSWTATSNANWLSITGGAQGTGSGAVGFTAAAHSGPARTGTLTIAGRTFTVLQAESCTFAIAPDQSAVDPAGGTLGIAITGPAGCAWTAAADVAWMRVTSAAAGSGSGTVQLAIDANPGAARSGTATIAGRTFTANQGSGCAFAIAPTSQNVGAGASSVPVAVTTSAGCAWSAASNASWLTVVSGSPGAGSGGVQIEVQANSGAVRTGTVTIAGQTLTVNQESGCTFVVSPETIPAAAGGGASRVEITAAAACAWAAASGAPWLSVTSNPNGAGNGAVDFSIAANTGPARSGTLTIAGRTVTVNQESGCTFALSASSQTMAAAGGSGSVGVTAEAGCGWTAASAVPWIAVTAGSAGAGAGTVQFTVEPNPTPGTPRAGTIAIAGLTFTVNQE